jgi:hypothetical protein
MPPIPHRERLSAVRAAVFEIALRDGAVGIHFPAVAAEVGTSLSTLRRWVSTADRLPRLGIDHVEYRRRCRLQHRAPGEAAGTELWQDALNLLLRALPFDKARLDDERVWNILILGFSDTQWAHEARAAQDHYLATLVRTVISGHSNLDLEFEERRLAVLVRGTLAGVLDGLISPAETTGLVQRHVNELSAARHLGRSRGAA